ncbi:hypothetical protein QJS10_CPA01g02616 [Acorus calamus]|uniref:Uncharacterized protein n=1 Tax=Acorus calamus TaxID=4465 RepID=A0AAV9FMM2_ACOCL|nr:hypothetical protein QJS10_CPA01g02616 [Acorus calamus]
MNETHNMFDLMPERDGVSWNTMISRILAERANGGNRESWSTTERLAKVGMMWKCERGAGSGVMVVEALELEMVLVSVVELTFDGGVSDGAGEITYVHIDKFFKGMIVVSKRCDVDKIVYLKKSDLAHHPWQEQDPEGLIRGDWVPPSPATTVRGRGIKSPSPLPIPGPQPTRTPTQRGSPSS